MKLALAIVALFSATSMAFAACPSRSPSVSSVTLQADDQRVNKAWLEKTLAGKRVKFAEGTEIYNADGSYTYKVTDGSFSAPEYRFYDSGFRCIGYSDPRFDFYVVNNGKLYLINGNGGRFQGRITN